MMFHHRASGDFLRAAAIATGRTRAVPDVLVLPLLFRADTAKMLAQAADVIAREPVTLQLRYLQTLTEIAVEKNSTIIFPLPVDTIKVFLDRLAAIHTDNGILHEPVVAE